MKRITGWIRGTKPRRDDATEVYLYCNKHVTIITPTICFQTFRGPMLPSQSFYPPIDLQSLAQCVLDRFAMCQWCDTETEFDRAIDSFFAHHDIAGWDALPQIFDHMNFRQLLDKQIQFGCYEKGTSEGYLSEEEAITISANQSEVESVLSSSLHRLHLGAILAEDNVSDADKENETDRSERS